MSYTKFLLHYNSYISKSYIFKTKIISTVFILFIILNNINIFAATNSTKTTKTTTTSKSNTAEIFETNDRFHPEVGLNGAVATQEELASKIGLEILKNGGNAIDAAVAIGYAMSVTLPRAGNIGGGGFMTIWSHKQQKAYVINYRETAPKKIDLDKIKSMSHEEFINSYYASGIPGTVAGFNLAVEKFGTMKLKELLKPAIKLAEDGFNIHETQMQGLNYAKDKLFSNKEAKEIFFKKTRETKGSNYYIPYKLGERLKQKDLAETLKLIAKYGNKGFYEGKTADLIIKAMSKHDNGKGLITKQDLKNYKAKLVEPLISNYKNYKIIAPPPPSSGGIVINQILKILERLDIEQYNYNSADYYHLLIESFNLSYLDRNYKLGDPNYIEINQNKLLSDNYIKQLASKINTKTHTSSDLIDQQSKQWREGKNTTHYVVIDKDLNVVSNTYTLNTSYGTGRIIPGAGFFINNELDDFTLALGQANAYGLIQGKNNIIEPGKQPLSSMTPIIILDQYNIPYIATGSPGGSRILTTISQIILNSISNNLNISASVAAPRIHSQLWPDILFYEQGISPDTLEKLKNMGHTLKETSSMGSAQSLQYKKPYFLATSDPRRAGAMALAY